MNPQKILLEVILALGRVMPGVIFLLLTREAEANPTGMTVQSGSASLNVNGSQLTVTAANNAFLNWQSFNIAAGQTTIFNQPSASSIVWNRINDQNPSQIYGSLQANGVVVLLNSSGFYFGPNSFVSAAGLVVSTANCAPPQNAGGAWVFNGPPPLASIVNYGQIKIGHGGDCFLIADKVENHGDIQAPGGNIGLAAGQTVTLSERPDGRGMSMLVTLPHGSVDNYGNLIADGGTISLHAKVVNQDGFIQANSVQNQNGIIERVADDQLNLGADSKIIAQGDSSAGGSAGGSITLKSGNNFADTAGGEIVAAGGVNGGNGGTIEISAPNILSLNSTLDATATTGFTGGEFLLDPVNIILGTSTAGGAINVSTAFAGFSSILLQASGNITLNQFTTWNLSGSTGVSQGQLTLQAGGNITLQNGSGITDANHWSVSLQAGYDSLNGVVNAGTGSINLNGSGFIQTAAGNISLQAGQDILINAKGYVRTSAGGNVSAWAMAGNIDTGKFAHGYTFSLADSANGTFYQVDPANGVGGISTEAGGNVTLLAGGDVTSFLPTGNGATAIGGDAGSGAFGPQAGNVTVIAGGNVTGHYVVANGTGNIFAGFDPGVALGASGNPILNSQGGYVLNPTRIADSAGSAGTLGTKLALSLVTGGWTVNAAQDIYLQEIRNPNGVFNVRASGATPPPSYHHFDYAPNAFLNLIAGNSVVLGDSSSSLPRDNGDGVNVPFIYAPILNIIAGVGGISLTGDADPYNKLILFPSPQGSLIINDAGSLTGRLDPNADGSTSIFNLIVSDSGQTQFYENSDIFGLGDHAATPIHLNNPTPIVLHIAGNMENVLLGAPEAAQITVGGDMKNSRFQGLNLHQLDTTSITVVGDILNRSDYTSVTAAQAPNLSYLTQAYPPSTLARNLANSIFYNPATKALTIKGPITAEVLSLLENLTVQVYGQNGMPLFNPDGSPVTQTVSVIDATTAAALATQYAALGPVPTTRDSGYLIGGGGEFNLSARNMDLGTTLGIQSQGVGLDTVTVFDASGNSHTEYPLARLFTQAADIHVTTTGNLDMFSTSIASLNGGNISVNAGGHVNVGSDIFTGNSAAARGIFTSAQGDVSVIAEGDINVAGSRIAAYDGGNVTVESLNGDINAGTGGSGYVVLTAYYVDSTGKVFTDAPTIPGSGILATTFPRRTDSYPAPAVSVGNILVEAPNGNINASSGGIVQLPLNGENNPDSIVEVLAGMELRDSSGLAVNAANLASGTPVQVSAGRDINARGSGVIGNTVKLNASGSIAGVIFARDNIDISAQQNVNVTALAQGSVNVNSGGTISGTIIGVGGISASGGSIDANLESNNGISGDTSGAKGMAQGSAANATSQAASASDATTTAAKTDTKEDDEPLKKKKGITLARKVSRVTVLLPGKN